MILECVTGSDRKTAEASTTPAKAILDEGYAILSGRILSTFIQKINPAI